MTSRLLSWPLALEKRSRPKLRQWKRRSKALLISAPKGLNSRARRLRKISAWKRYWDRARGRKRQPLSLQPRRPKLSTKRFRAASLVARRSPFAKTTRGFRRQVSGFRKNRLLAPKASHRSASVNREGHE